MVKAMREFIPREIHQTHTGHWSLVHSLVHAKAYVALYKRHMNINEMVRWP